MDAFEVSGHLQNVTDDIIKHVQLEAEYYDKNSNLVLTQTEDFYDLAAQSQEKYFFRMEDSQYFKIVEHLEFKVHIYAE